MVPWERDTRIGRNGVSLSGLFQTSLPETDPQAVTAAGAAFSEVSHDSLLRLGADLASRSAERQAHSGPPEVGSCHLQLSSERLWVGRRLCSAPCCLPRTGWNILGLCTLVPSGVRGQGQDSFVSATLCLWVKAEPPWASVSSLVNRVLGAPLADPPGGPSQSCSKLRAQHLAQPDRGILSPLGLGVWEVLRQTPVPQQQYQNGESEESHAQFLKALQNAVTTFVNRMKSNHVRGRSITNDSAVLSLFQSINTMHPQLLELLNQLDERRCTCTLPGVPPGLGGSHRACHTR